MFCKYCGNEIENGATFCPNCGTPVESSVPAQPQPQAPVYNTQAAYGQPAAVTPLPMKKSIISLILGIAGAGSFWLGCFGPFGFISVAICIVGLIIGGQAKRENPRNKMGKTGWILSLVGLILAAVLTIIMTLILAIAVSDGYYSGI